MNDYVIGVDIGGTNVRVGLVNEKLEVITKEMALTHDFGTAEELFIAIRQMIGIVDAKQRTNKIGIAMPVPWRRDTEFIADATNIPYLENVSIRAIRSYFPEHEVYFENDVNVIAYLESERGASRGSSHSIYITVSTGIGSGIIVGNEILHGAHGYAGEIGSMFVSDQRNDKGNETLETLCSGKALEDVSKKLYGEDATSSLLFERYLAKDNRAAEVITVWVERFSRAIASLMQTFDPDVFVLGGAVIDNNRWLIDQVIEHVKSKVLHNLRSQIRITIPAFGLDAGMIGAGYTALRQSQQVLRY
jgi:glucokinase